MQNRPLFSISRQFLVMFELVKQRTICNLRVGTSGLGDHELLGAAWVAEGHAMVSELQVVSQMKCDSSSSQSDSVERIQTTTTGVH